MSSSENSTSFYGMPRNSNSNLSVNSNTGNCASGADSSYLYSYYNSTTQGGSEVCDGHCSQNPHEVFLLPSVIDGSLLRKSKTIYAFD
ncbi:hypothetical protein DASC09_024230 [Saccharomycopsis crataegensis]|uniref:Uncharacterized protein n=1 Tax=Saccharomycopsis crataegensis TaxID=43959 RepID=A0AAV5QLP8_9ASCO|nr:hypothetical protein DASC09_024230 [Saccharomycopsis crataegensis]